MFCYQAPMVSNTHLNSVLNNSFFVKWQSPLWTEVKCHFITLQWSYTTSENPDMPSEKEATKRDDVWFAGFPLGFFFFLSFFYSCQNDKENLQAFYFLQKLKGKFSFRTERLADCNTM